MWNASFSLYTNGSKKDTIITLLDKCKSMLELKQIHGLLLTLGLSQLEPFATRLLSYAASDLGDIDYSYRVFLHLPNPTIFNWNTIIRGCSNSKIPNQSLWLFRKMLRLGVSPDHLTYPFLVKASGQLLNPELGTSIHAHISKTGYESDRFVSNALIHMYASCGDIAYARKVFDGIHFKNLVSWNSMVDGYAKCGNMKFARELFDLMPERDVVSWSSLIDGYVKCGDYEGALVIFEKMRIWGPKANEVTMVSVLCACAHLGALDKGRSMHLYIMDNGLPVTLVLRTSLVDMYAKCGAIEEAYHVFRGIPMEHTDVLIWNAIIGGLATHGFAEGSLHLFTEMQVNGIRPDEVTYLCLLSACAHGGLVKEAWYFFDCLGKHGVIPKIEHYACMVDVMARSGQVEEAYRFLGQLSMAPTASMLGALHSGCLNHGKLYLAELVGRKLIELEPDHDGRYIGLSNVYATVRCWDKARNMRKEMERRGVKKSPGYSFVEMYGALHKFIAHDKSHRQSGQIYMMLNFIAREMKLELLDENQEYSLSDIEGI